MTDAPETVNSIVLASGLRQSAAMRFVFYMLGFVLLVAGCDTSLSYYHRAGVSVTRMQTDTTRCEVRALQDAPVANEIRQRPPIFVPGRQICDAAGNCWSRPGYWVSGGFYTVDANLGLRDRVMDLCMSQKGYTPVSVPACSASVKKLAPPRRTTILPTITDQSCSIQYEDDSWQIVSTIPAKN